MKADTEHTEAMDDVTEKDILLEIYVQLNAIRSLMYFLFGLAVLLAIVMIVTSF